MKFFLPTVRLHFQCLTHELQSVQLALRDGTFIEDAPTYRICAAIRYREEHNAWYNLLRNSCESGFISRLGVGIGKGDDAWYCFYGATESERFRGLVKAKRIARILGTREIKETDTVQRARPGPSRQMELALMSFSRLQTVPQQLIGHAVLP
jgi:hypothetical protein